MAYFRTLVWSLVLLLFLLAALHGGVQSPLRPFLYPLAVCLAVGVAMRGEARRLVAVSVLLAYAISETVIMLWPFNILQTPGLEDSAYDDGALVAILVVPMALAALRKIAG